MAANYTVTDQRPVTDAVPGGTFVPAMEITFTTKPHNIAGRVRVPMSHYTATEVDTIVSAQAALMESVQEL
jgi:hypothetical protein